PDDINGYDWADVATLLGLDEELLKEARLLLETDLSENQRFGILTAIGRLFKVSRKLFNRTVSESAGYLKGSKSISLRELINSTTEKSDIFGIGIDHDSPVCIQAVIDMIPLLVESGYKTVFIEHFPPESKELLSDSLNDWIREGGDFSNYKEKILTREKYKRLNEYINDLIQTSAEVLKLEDYLTLLKSFLEADLKIVPIDTRDIGYVLTKDLSSTETTSAEALDTYMKEHNITEAVVVYGSGHLQGSGLNLRTELERRKRIVFTVDIIPSNNDYPLTDVVLRNAGQVDSLIIADVRKSPMHNIAHGYSNGDALVIIGSGMVNKPYEFYYNLGCAHAKLGNHAEAIDAYQKALALEPENALARQGLIASYIELAKAYTTAGKHAEAITIYKRILELTPGDEKAQESLIAAYKSYGNLCYNSDRYEEAIEAYNNYLRFEPDDIVILKVLGLAYGKIGKWAEDRDAHLKVIELSPQDASAHFNLGVAYTNLGNYAEAINAYQKALNLNPDDPNTHYNLGFVYANSGKYNEAINAYQQAIKLNPRYAKAYYNLGFIYVKLGKNDQAIEAYKMVISIAGAGDLASSAQQQIDLLNTQPAILPVLRDEEESKKAKITSLLPGHRFIEITPSLQGFIISEINNYPNLTPAQQEFIARHVIRVLLAIDITSSDGAMMFDSAIADNPSLPNFLHPHESVAIWVSLKYILRTSLRSIEDLKSNNPQDIQQLIRAVVAKEASKAEFTPEAKTIAIQLLQAYDPTYKYNLESLGDPLNDIILVRVPEEGDQGWAWGGGTINLNAIANSFPLGGNNHLRTALCVLHEKIHNFIHDLSGLGPPMDSASSNQQFCEIVTTAIQFLCARKAGVNTSIVREMSYWGGGARDLVVILDDLKERGIFDWEQKEDRIQLYKMAGLGDLSPLLRLYAEANGIKLSALQEHFDLARNGFLYSLQTDLMAPLKMAKFTLESVMLGLRRVVEKQPPAPSGLPQLPTLPAVAGGVVSTGQADATSLYQSGIALAESGRYDEAITELIKAINLDPNYVLAYNSLADIYFKLGRFAEAIAIYKRILEFARHDEAKKSLIAAYISYGNLCYNSDRFEEAIEAYNNYLRFEPDDIVILKVLGLAYGKIGKWA
ncbi:MAG: tetratricopeptide repeat protein, partial [Candidatus Omnitrophica bacterium]|nr:tetratricopeptide repeat protein [Candidatus Omnitrophota bacterium]